MTHATGTTSGTELELRLKDARNKESTRFAEAFKAASDVTLPFEAPAAPPTPGMDTLQRSRRLRILGGVFLSASVLFGGLAVGKPAYDAWQERIEHEDKESYDAWLEEQCEVFLEEPDAESLVRAEYDAQTAEFSPAFAQLNRSLQNKLVREC